ncbi:MAG: ABC transporter permease [bacterium]|nr:ABC transporter permease [bacterium]
MKTPIAICNLMHQGVKTLVSVGGVAFALLLVFMQLGFMGAVENTAKNVFEKLDCDIVIRARDYVHLYESGMFDRHWLQVAQNTAGVDQAVPLWVLVHNWRRLPTADELHADRQSDSGPEIAGVKAPQAQSFVSQYLPIAIMAFEPGERVFRPGAVPGMTRHEAALKRSEAILLDDDTKPDYGPWNGSFFSTADLETSQDPAWPERRPEIGGQSFEIAGLFELGTGLAANGAAIMGRSAFERISPFDLRRSVSLGLIRVNDPRPQEVRQVVERLRSRMQVLSVESSGPSPLSVAGASSQEQSMATQAAVSILSKQEAIRAEQNRWVWGMPIGLIFQMGVAISLLVGAAIVYMVLSTDVTNRLPEYATLLAMGYSRRYLSSIVMTQATVLCALGFLAAWGMGEILYRITSIFSGIPMHMSAFNVALVAVLGFIMCCASGLFALKKLWKAEPASLF